MNRRYKPISMMWFIVCLTVLPLPLNARAEEIAVQAVVDRTHLSPGESLQLKVILRGGAGDPDLSGLDDFKVFSQGTSSSVRIVNNTTTREETHTYLLIPQREGQLTIPPISVTAGGRSSRTEPITISVLRRPVSETGEKEVWVESSLSDTQPYAGQQITYAFSLYQAVRVNNATFQPPEFTGFTASEIKERDSERKNINGREHVVTTVRYILTPLEAGRRVIEPAVLQVGIIRQETQRRRSPFDDFFSDPFLNRNRVEPRVLQSAPLSVDVRALPPYAGTAPFSGLVGRFQLSAALQDTRIKVGDSTTLTITIQGQGNIVDARAPSILFPPPLKTYADAPDEEIQLTPAGYNGRKVYRTAMVPLQTGELQLPSVRLTYFDVEQADYRTLTAMLPSLHVQPANTASAAPLTVAAEPQETRKQKVTFTGRDILPPKEGLEALQSQSPLPWTHFLLWLSLPAMAFAALTLVQRLRRPDARPRARMRAKAHNALKIAQSCRQTHDIFLTALYQALTAAIYGYAGRSGEALTWREAETCLRDSGMDAESARQAADLLAAIESNRFSNAQLSVPACDELLKCTRRMVKRMVP